jgi:hypothetical protein
VLGAVDDVVAVQRRHRDRGQVADLELRGEAGELLDDLVVDRLIEADEVHLVDRHDDVRHPQQGGDERVAARLLEHALARVDQHHGQVGGRGAGDHVARVLRVAGGVGDDERAPRRREVAVGDVDRDALLALGAQPVGEQGEVGVGVAAALASALDRLQLVLEDLLGVVEQAADERALAVVHRAGGGEAQELGRALVGPRHRPVAGHPGHQK